MTKVSCPHETEQQDLATRFFEYICSNYSIGMNRTRKADNLDAKFQLRLRKKDLAKYKAKAAGLGLSLSEMILSALDGVPVRDR